MDDHRELVEAARAAIDRVFSDTSVGRETTKESLRELADDIRERREMMAEEDA